MSKKLFVAIIAVCLLAGGVVGGSIAWLMDITNEVTNTFTLGDVDIELKETTGDSYKMVPGTTIRKDPTVTIVDGSENAWVFIEITKTNNPDTYLEYTIDNRWQPLAGVDNVYYYDYAAASGKVELSVLTGNSLTVKSTIKKDAITDGNEPKLTFKAYAIQKDGFANATLAWEEISK